MRLRTTLFQNCAVQWNVGQNAFTGPVVVEFGSLQGWKQHPSSGAWTNTANGSADSVERTISVFVKELATAGR